MEEKEKQTLGEYFTNFLKSPSPALVFVLILAVLNYKFWIILFSTLQPAAKISLVESHYFFESKQIGWMLGKIGVAAVASIAYPFCMDLLRFISEWTRQKISNLDYLKRYNDLKEEQNTISEKLSDYLLNQMFDYFSIGEKIIKKKDKKRFDKIIDRIRNKITLKVELKDATEEEMEFITKVVNEIKIEKKIGLFMRGVGYATRNNARYEAMLQEARSAIGSDQNIEALGDNINLFKSLIVFSIDSVPSQEQSLFLKNSKIKELYDKAQKGI